MLNFLVEHASYLGFVAFLAMCGVGLPIPEEAPLVLAGVLSSHGDLNPPLAFIACLVGALLGDSVMYGIGRRCGHEFLTQHPMMARFVDVDKEEHFEHVVRRHGFKVLLLTRFLVGVRGPVYFAAGAARVPYLRFLAWDLVAASLVVGVVFSLAYFFGDRIAEWVSKAELVVTIVVVATVAVAGYLFYRRRTARTEAVIAQLEEEDEKLQATGATAEPTHAEKPDSQELSA